MRRGSFKSNLFFHHKKQSMIAEPKEPVEGEQAEGTTDATTDATTETTATTDTSNGGPEA